MIDQLCDCLKMYKYKSGSAYLASSSSGFSSSAWWIWTEDLLLVRTAPLLTRLRRTWWACIVGDATYDKRTCKKLYSVPRGQCRGQTDGRTDRTNLYSSHIFKCRGLTIEANKNQTCWKQVTFNGYGGQSESSSGWVKSSRRRKATPPYTTGTWCTWIYQQ